MTLSNSPELGRLRVFHPVGRLTEASYKSDEFKSLVLRLNPDTALVVAICWGFPTPFISELIRRGANPNADYMSFSDANNMHVLEAACAKSKVEVVRVLLDAGAQPLEKFNAQSNDAFLLAATQDSSTSSVSYTTRASSRRAGPRMNATICCIALLLHFRTLTLRMCYPWPSSSASASRSF